MSDTALARRAVLDAARALASRGLVEGTSGNVSARVDEGRVCLTPSSLRYDAMTLDDLVVVGLDGGVLEGDRSPTSPAVRPASCHARNRW